MLKDSLRVSLELWLEFARHASVRIRSRQSPLTICRSEVLGRALFSGHVKNNKIRPNAFPLSPKSLELSVNRLSHASRTTFVRLSKLDSSRRSKRATEKQGKHIEINFYGFAELLESDIQSLTVDGKRAMRSRSDMTRANPFHAVLQLEKDDGKDFYLAVADQLLSVAKYASAE